MTDPRILIISPVRNEAAHIDRVVAGVAAQTRPPSLWLVVDDGSTDGTLETLRKHEGELALLRVLEAPEHPTDGGSPDRLALAAEARAFRWAFGQVSKGAFDFVGKLDGDIELPPDYFERLLEHFSASGTLGIGGGTLIEPSTGGRWRRLRIPEHHVHGALKLYRLACYQAIGGMEERLGWDTIDETYARMHGFTTRSFPAIVARHHRPAGGAQGLLRGRARHGECAYILHYSVPWILLRSLKMATQRPVVLSGLAFVAGFARAALGPTSQVPDEGFRRFVRAELRGRVRRVLSLGLVRS
jgi:hypothetical protein